MVILVHPCLIFGASEVLLALLPNKAATLFENSYQQTHHEGVHVSVQGSPLELLLFRGYQAIKRSVDDEAMAGFIQRSEMAGSLVTWILYMH